MRECGNERMWKCENVGIRLLSLSADHSDKCGNEGIRLPFALSDKCEND